jgi:hypothetical protein
VMVAATARRARSEAGNVGGRAAIGSRQSAVGSPGTGGAFEPPPRLPILLWSRFCEPERVRPRRKSTERANGVRPRDVLTACAPRGRAPPPTPTADRRFPIAMAGGPSINAASESSAAIRPSDVDTPGLAPGGLLAREPAVPFRP